MQAAANSALQTVELMQPAATPSQANRLTLCSTAIFGTDEQVAAVADLIRQMPGLGQMVPAVAIIAANNAEHALAAYQQHSEQQGLRGDASHGSIELCGHFQLSSNSQETAANIIQYCQEMLRFSQASSMSFQLGSLILQYAQTEGDESDAQHLLQTHCRKRSKCCC